MREQNTAQLVMWDSKQTPCGSSADFDNPGVKEWHWDLGQSLTMKLNIVPYL